MAKYRAFVGGNYGSAQSQTSALQWSHPVGLSDITPGIISGSTALRTASYFTQAGYIEDWLITMSANTSAVDLVWEVYKNGVATGIQITVPSGSGAGTFTNSTKLDVAVDDYVQMIINTASGPQKAFTLQNMGGWFVTSQKPYGKFTAGGNTTISIATNSNPVYTKLWDAKGSNVSTIPLSYNAVFPCEADISIWVYVNSNTRTVNSTLYVNVDGTRTSYGLVVPAGATGFFKTTTPYTILQGEKVVGDWDVSGGSGTIQFMTIGMCAQTDTKSYPTFMNAIAIPGNTTNRYWFAWGHTNTSGLTTPTIRYLEMKGKGVIRNLFHYPYANTSTTDAVIGIYKNGVETSVVATIPAGSTSVVSDIVNEVSYEEGDLICIYTRRSGSLNNSTGLSSVEIVPQREGGFIPKAIYY